MNLRIFLIELTAFLAVLAGCELSVHMQKSSKIICSETLEAKALRNDRWRTFDSEHVNAYGLLVTRGEIELLDGHGERETLSCHDAMYPEKTWMAAQRWYRRKT